MSSLKSTLCRRADVWVPLLAACTFLPSLRAGFVYDDVRLIVENAFVSSPEHWARAFSTHFWDVSTREPSADLLRLYRPLVTLSYLGNWLVGAGQAWTFHLTNVLLHALNAWLVLQVALRLTKARFLAVLSALLFALHPTRSEAVTWVSGRPDPLMTAFVLLTVQSVNWGRRQEARPLATLSVVLSFCAALLSKEPALATPALLLADAANAAGPDRPGSVQATSERAWRLSMVGLTASLGAGYLLLRHWFLPVGTPPISWTPAHALVTLSHYAERAVFPWPMTFFYKLEELAGQGARRSPWELALGLSVALGTLAWILRAFRRDRTTFWLLCAGVAFLGPLLNLFETGSRFTTSDRFLYLPLWLLVVAGCRALSGSPALARGGRRGTLVLAGLVTICIGANVERTFDFVDQRSFWSSELAASPDNPVALRGLSVQQLAVNDTAGAIESLQHSLQLRALRYHRVATRGDHADAYGRLVALEASVLPDGAVGALGALVQDAVDRLGAKPRQTGSGPLSIDWPENDESVRWLALYGEETVARHLVAVATRLDIHDVSLSLLDAVSDEHLHLAPNPLSIALSEAREQRFARAKERIGVMRARRHLMPKVVTEAALVNVEARIVSARTLFESAAALGVDERRLARARAFANLGAFLRALFEVQQADPRDPAMRPLYVQLLVSARLERVALQVASQALGSVQGAATIAAIRAQLSPELQALAPVDLSPAATESSTL